METLAEALIGWSAAHPLNALEQEVVLVQSNATAEWFKMLQAQRQGLCAATRVELPARFLWRSWRQIMGSSRVPSLSPLDKAPLTWRLMRLLPDLIQKHPLDFAPLEQSLSEESSLMALCRRVADLFDQYQIYRSDWLNAWEQRKDAPGLELRTIPPDQRWQPALWRALVDDLAPEERRLTRAQLHQRVLERLKTSPQGSLPVARRVLLLGLTHMPRTMLEFLVALSRHSQIVLAVPDPSRFHWVDATGNALLAAWGQQNRDYVRLLDEYESQDVIRRTDSFTEEPMHQGSLLEQLQRSVRDLAPLSEHPRRTNAEHFISASDQSIVLRSAHTLVRELETLHEHLLRLFSYSGLGLGSGSGSEIEPRDVIVMLPNIGASAPAIEAVFGQHSASDPRRIPFSIADLRASQSTPLGSALVSLLRLPQQRWHLSELVDLLDTPAIAARLGLRKPSGISDLGELGELGELSESSADLAQLRHWLESAGVRWGLSQRQRQEDFALGACGQRNTARFGLERMLLGYASKRNFGQLEPLEGVGGLDAELVGMFATLLNHLEQWSEQVRSVAVPQVWAQRLRVMLEGIFAPQSEADKAVLQTLELAQQEWLNACQIARFEQELSFSQVQSVWLQALESIADQERFQAGGVTFCTFMPMRAIPFKVVCLLGMNEGEFPRWALRDSFDLMQLAGQHRAGDRSRRDHERQLMLDAVLSARDQLYISWCGQSQSRAQTQPPSVLVEQLRDYLRAGWRGQGSAEDALLQERSRSERLLGQMEIFRPNFPPIAKPITPLLPTAKEENFEQMLNFIAHPARYYLRHHLQISFDYTAHHRRELDEEAFSLSGLDTYQLLTPLHQQFETLAIEESLDALERSGALPLANLGTQAKAALQQCLSAQMRAWRKLSQNKNNLILLHAGKLCGGEKHMAKLLPFYLRSARASLLCERAIEMWIIGTDGCLHAELAHSGASAQAAMSTLHEAWETGRNSPLALPKYTAAQLVISGGNLESARKTYETRAYPSAPAPEVQDMRWARLFADFDALSKDGQFEYFAQKLYAPLKEWHQALRRLTWDDKTWEDID